MLGSVAQDRVQDMVATIPHFALPPPSSNPLLAFPQLKKLLFQLVEKLTTSYSCTLAPPQFRMGP